MCGIFIRKCSYKTGLKGESLNLYTATGSSSVKWSQGSFLSKKQPLTWYKELLEKYNVPFVGTRSSECRQAFDKYKASSELGKLGFVTVPSFLVEVMIRSLFLVVVMTYYTTEWFKKHQLDPDMGKVVVHLLKENLLSYCTLFCGNFVVLRSKKKMIVSRSSPKEEFRVMALRICLAIMDKTNIEYLKIQSECLMKFFLKTNWSSIIHFNMKG